uniref:Uncharacterized protein n=1 Tax=Sphaerodactylus townsendi TaxID=933632 RepID=A0ACB8G460_9SAUR
MLMMQSAQDHHGQVHRHSITLPTWPDALMATSRFSPEREIFSRSSAERKADAGSERGNPTMKSDGKIPRARSKKCAPGKRASYRSFQKSGKEDNQRPLLASEHYNSSLIFKRSPRNGSSCLRLAAKEPREDLRPLRWREDGASVPERAAEGTTMENSTDPDIRSTSPNRQDCTRAGGQPKAQQPSSDQILPGGWQQASAQELVDLLRSP